jgi:hypothetical protein
VPRSCCGTESGILTVRLHTNGGPVVFTGQTHHDLPHAFAEIGADRDNKVVILTGFGGVFMDEIDAASLGEIFKPGEWDKIYWEGRRVLQRLLEIETPIIAAARLPPSSPAARPRHPAPSRGSVTVKLKFAPEGLRELAEGTLIASGRPLEHGRCHA